MLPDPDTLKKAMGGLPGPADVKEEGPTEPSTVGIQQDAEKKPEADPQKKLADGTDPEKKTVPWDRFQALNEKTRALEARLKEKEQGDAEKKLADAFTPDGDTELDPGNVEKMIDSRLQQLESRIAEALDGKLGALNQVALDSTVRAEMDLLAQEFPTRFDPGRDMPDIRKMQEDIPGISAADAFLRLDHGRLAAENQSVAEVQKASVDTSATMGAPSQLGPVEMKIEKEDERLMEAFGYNTAEEKQKFLKDVEERTRQNV